jgi:hypothetical protein
MDFLLTAGALELTIPWWLQVLLWSAAGIAAATTIWKLLLRPMARLVTTLDDLRPLLIELHKRLGETPRVWEILGEIVAQVRTDGGSTLLDMVTGLHEAAAKNRVASEVLSSNVEAVKQLAASDRAGAAKDRLVLEQALLEIRALTGKRGRGR